MNSKFSVVLAICVAILFGMQGTAYADLSESAKKQITSLKKELAEIDTEFAALKPTYASITEEKRRLSDVDELLVGAIKHHKKEVQEHNQRVRDLDLLVSDHNGRCSGSFEDKGYVAACNAEAARLNAQQRHLDAEIETERQMKQGLEERIDSLSQATSEWSQKAKTYNAKIDDLTARQNTLLLRMNSVLEDLKRREKVAVTCPEMASLEDAHHCLQRVWDGAR